MTIDEFLKEIDEELSAATESQVSAFEKVIGCDLPTDYRDFLLRCRGDHGCGLGLNENMEIEVIGGFEEGRDLLEERKYFNDPENPQIPDTMIWIMSDAFGNAYCLGIKEDVKGQVFFHDHEVDPDDPESLEIVGSSFTEFVSNLKIIELDEV